MFTRSLATATRYFFETFWSMEGGCDVKMVDSPGKPIGCMNTRAITIWEGQGQGQEGKIGFYPRIGITVTYSAKLLGTPITDLENFLHKPRIGFNDYRDAIAAFLMKNRWKILEWANLLVDGTPVTGLVNNLIEAPKILGSSQPTRRGPDWWGEAIGRVVGSAQEESRIIGYSSDISFGQALVMQTDAPNEF